MLGNFTGLAFPWDQFKQDHVEDHDCSAVIQQRLPLNDGSKLL